MPLSLADVRDKADAYQQYAQRKCNAHYRVSRITAAFHTVLGAIATICSAAIGVSILAKLAEDSPRLTLILGLASFGAAALTGVQTRLKYAEAAEEHRRAAGSYEALRQEMDLFFLRHPEGSGDRSPAVAEFDALVHRFQELAEKSPPVPDWIYNGVSRRRGG